MSEKIRRGGQWVKHEWKVLTTLATILGTGVGVIYAQPNRSSEVIEAIRISDIQTARAIREWIEYEQNTKNGCADLWKDSNRQGMAITTAMVTMATDMREMHDQQHKDSVQFHDQLTELMTALIDLRKEIHKKDDSK